MSDAELLYALLAALYLFECLVFVGPTAFVVQRLAPWAWRVTRPARIASRWDGAIALGAPWPPLQASFVCEPWPLAMDESGVQSAAGPRRVIPWSEVAEVTRVGRVLMHDGQALVRLSSNRAAANTLGQLRGLAERGGDGIDRVLSATLSVSTATERLAAFHQATLSLRVLQNLLLLAIFGGGAVLLWSPWSGLWREIALAGVSLFLLGGWWSRRALRRVLPVEAQPPLATRISLYVSPISTLRAHDVIAREVLGDLHPLAVAVAARAPVHALARETLSHARWPAAGDACQDAWAARLDAALTRFAERVDLDVDDLLAAPERDGGEVIAWCPHCRGQYVRVDDGCTSCPGVRLLPFPSAT